MNELNIIYDLLMEVSRRRGWQGEDSKLFTKGYIFALEKAVQENKCTYRQAIEMCVKENVI